MESLQDTNAQIKGPFVLSDIKLKTYKTLA